MTGDAAGPGPAGPGPAGVADADTGAALAGAGGAADHGLPATTSRAGLVTGLVLGVPVIAYGIRGVLVDGARTRPGELARWIVGAAVVHDLVLVPVVLAVGWGLRRLVPASVWPAVRAGLVTTGVLMLVGWPFVRGYGRDPTDPSLLPRDYGTGLAVAVACVWLGVAGWAVVEALGRRRRR
jgi:hypothetical protein